MNKIKEHNPQNRKKMIRESLKTHKHREKLNSFGYEKESNFIMAIMMFLCLAFIIFCMLVLIKDYLNNYKIEPRTIIMNENTLIATITAYTSSVDETDDTPFITASGKKTGNGIIACPPKYPFGTQVEIEGRLFVCEDRMNKRYHNQERFDIWMETKDDAYNWGLRKLVVNIR